MGGPCSVQIYTDDKGLVAQAEAEVRRIEQKYSRYRENSVISRINRGENSELDQETLGLLNYASTAFELSNGLFDITAGILRTAWDFKTNALPKPAQLQSCLAAIGWDKVALSGESIQLCPSMQIDFGGIGKEYAADCVCDLLLELGAQSGLIELAGDIRVFGTRPNNKPWAIGISHPRPNQAVGTSPYNAIATIPLISGAVCTSGDYQRFIEVDGQRYCHILNPKTGYPSNELLSCSVYAPRCLIAGTASTVAMLMNKADAINWLNDLGLAWLIVDAELNIISSQATAQSAKSES